MIRRIYFTAFIILLIYGGTIFAGEAVDMDQRQTAGTIQYAIVGGGCFWCMEAVFQRIEGIVSVTSGYAGGTVASPTYEAVCTGNTGHAEVVEIGFDPHAISYEEVLSVFFKAHDPTTLNRQGADVGPQYRSVIFYRNEEERQTAEMVIAEVQKEHEDAIVTELQPFTVFYKAEDYHQNYYNRNTTKYTAPSGYCRAVIQPKLQKLELE